MMEWRMNEKKNCVFIMSFSAPILTHYVKCSECFITKKINQCTNYVRATRPRINASVISGHKVTLDSPIIM